ncbi:MAG TPA: hypothetical protein VJ852_13235 [Gemmatimonadaceae bacterium]|nr:hypothetical protein [Gemmatimonadaceae bacterium]
MPNALLLARSAFALTICVTPGLVAQIPARPPDSSALEQLLSAAARVNSQIPDRLRSYRARIETEMSVVVLDSGGRERSTQIEQIASDVRWRAPDRYDQRVIGYRSQSIGPTFSLMSFFGGWTIPTLYGNRLQLGVTSASDPSQVVNAPRQSLTVHPLAFNRNQYYQFEGGDTAVTLYSSARRIPIAHVKVTPRPNPPGDAILFMGEMYLDADWKQIVRMRGRLVEVRNGKVTINAGSRIPGVSGASFVELVNQEVNGEYWLPAFQRTEIQARVALFGDFRTLLRIVSRFDDYRVNDSSWTGPEAPPGVTHNLTFASNAAQQRFHDWRRPIGAASSDVYYGELNDLAPAEWRTSFDTRGTRFWPRTLGEVFRFNRIEGLFTGVAVEHQFRDSTPQLTAHGSIGWAWSEQTARGLFSLERRGTGITTGLRLERSLANTNDFQVPFSWGATLSALLGSSDNFDYLDRWGASAYVGKALGLKQRSLISLQVGYGADRAVQQNISQGLYVAKGEGFRPNRGIREGNYFRSVAVLDLNPEVSGMFVDRGVGARLYYERADGNVNWQRAELRLAARREVGPFQLYMRADGGTLLGKPAPQVMFELGGEEGLTAYSYKEFAGDNAALLRAVLGYTFPFLRAPIQLPSRLIVPGLAPGLAAGIHGGWAEISGPAAQRALLELGTFIDPVSGLAVPVSRPTDGVRASAEFLFTLFNGAAGIGVTRVIDARGPWKFTARLGQGF